VTVLCLNYKKRYTKYVYDNFLCRSQWPRGLRRRSEAARLLRLWVRIPPGSWMSVSYECYVLSGRGLCVGLTTRPEESCRPSCVVGWPRNLMNGKALGSTAKRKKRQLSVVILQIKWIPLDKIQNSSMPNSVFIYSYVMYLKGQRGWLLFIPPNLKIKCMYFTPIDFSCFL